MPPTTRVIQCSLNSGELSPLARGRMDSPRYHNGLKSCDNFRPMILGGATKRDGTVRAGTAAGATVKLIPYQAYASATLAGYCLEFSHHLITIYKNGAPVRSGLTPVTVVSPYSVQDVPWLRWAQYQADLYLLHPVHQPRVLTRITDTDWSLTTLDLQKWPFARPVGTAAITITPGATSGSVYLTASAPLFVSGHVGSRFMVNGGIALVTAYHTSQSVTATFEQRVVIPTGFSYVTTTFTVTYDPATMVGTEQITLTSTAKRTSANYLDMQDAVTTAPATLPDGITLTSSSSATVADGSDTLTTSLNLEMVKASIAEAGSFTIAVVVTRLHDGTSPTWKPEIFNDIPALPAGIDVTASSVNYGYTGLEADAHWSEQAWSDLRGWPITCCFFEQRAVFGGNAAWPNYLWLSRIADFTDYTDGALADEPFTVIATAAVTPIVNLAATDSIYIFTQDRELTLDGGTGGALTPTNLTLKTRTTHGSAIRPMPVVTAGEIMFFSPSATLARTLSWRFDLNRYTAPDLSLLAEHLLRDGIIACAWAREPYLAYFAVTATGNLITCTYDRDQEVTAWAPLTLGGAGTVIDICVTPGADGKDQLWLAVSRTGGNSIEMMWPGIYLDCYTFDALADHWPGLTAYEGQTLTAVLDGVVYEGLTVTDGTLTFPVTPTVSAVAGYPYTATITDLAVDLTAQGTTQLGAIMGIQRIRVRFDSTAGAVVNGQDVPMRALGGGLLDTAHPEYTGDYVVEQFGRSTEPESTRVTLTHSLPLPCTVLAIVKEVLVNG